MTQDLKGRTAIVTGSGQNIGKAIALTLARAGANIVVNGLRDKDKIESVAAEIRALGVESYAVLADAADPDAIAHVVDEAAKHFGSVDIAVSNVGIRPHQAFTDISVDDWQKVINIDLNSAFYLAKAVVPHMRKKQFGRIIHLSGSEGVIPMPNRAHVNVAKAGMLILAKSIALELGPDGITANCICPGWIDTDRDMKNYPDLQNIYRHARETLPARRLGTVEDIANACLYLVSEMGGYVTGNTIYVDGGDSML
ncbi:SDR family NAD(P)-dependent oxidoreductase [Mesorhizobium sp. STM 4661]|uniref:SDR family NAD(P)-dependent oxidoreductase n=1 Tax=Mesorhizobium sp. STM 4661 TaxID=1297570 RepID=UPI0002BF708E|nr:SDR family NAD(P)-dependent oxidoreductase [Mesorhizobium sp. STM 4661]CCV11236.1 3-oxoacyl-(Acyl-carrier protein) reductase [Mesorhizobium sp. STM 4661]